MLLLDKQGTVTPENSRTHIRIPFELGEGVERLELRFEYAPKTLDDRERALELIRDSYKIYILPEQQEQASARAERHLPLKNLITLSLDDPGGYRGACHRHDPVQELSISREQASPGLTAGELLSGTWSVTLSLHCIITDLCEYRLRVDAFEEGQL